MTQANMMNSGYERLADDDYKTIDKRCVYAFLEHFKPMGLCVDPCAPSGSGIVDTLNECGYKATGTPDAFVGYIAADWIISNPPYRRGLVDEIIWRQIERLKAFEVNGVAMLMRWQFDHAAAREEMFKHNPRYYGQIKTLFRPQWFEKRPGDKQPFHPYVWHIWKRNDGWIYPVTMYSKGEKP
jgi:hypothetical protein